MRYSALSAPIACSVALHFAVLHFGWQIYASDTGASAPWRRPVLRAILMATAAPAPVIPAATPAKAQSAPPPDPRLAREEPLSPPQVMAPSDPLVKAVPEAPPADPAQPAEMPDSAFLDPGGVDQMARPAVNPEIVLPKSGSGKALNWVISFDLLIDATGKVVRVENISDGAPGEVIGEVLAAFFTVPYEPARLAGQPVAIRQRFSVQPNPGPMAEVNPVGAPKGASPPCAGLC
jgi:hypothetical protein